MQRDAWDRGERFCWLAEFVFRLLRRQPCGRHCVASGGERLFSGRRVCRVAPRWDPNDVELEAVTEREREEGLS